MKAKIVLSRFLFMWIVSVGLFSHPALAQSTLRIQHSHASSLSAPLKGDAAFFYEKSFIVKEEIGPWAFRLGEKKSASINVLNKQGQFEEVIRFMDDDEVIAHIEFQYNDANQLQQISESSRYLTRSFLIQYQYDDKGRLIHIDNKLGEQLLSTVDIAYQSKGRSTELTKIEGQKHYSVAELRRDVLEKRENFDSSGTVQFTQLFYYQKDGSMDRMVVDLAAPDKADNEIVYQYQYDEQGNWVKRLEHNQATGVYTIHHRTIVYRNQLASLDTPDTPLGNWSCGTTALFLKVEENGDFAFIDFQEREVMRGKWEPKGWGRFQFRVRHEDQFGNRYPFRANQGLTGELREGRLILHLDGSYHFDFIHQDVEPITDHWETIIRLSLWEKNLWEKPGYRDPKAIPADIAATFDAVRPIAPDRFKACLDTDCGVVDGTGRVILPFIYEQIGYVADDVYSIRVSGKAGLIDSLGQEILPTIYDRVWPEPKIGANIYGTRSAEGRYYFNATSGEFFPYEKEDLLGFNNDRWVARKGRYWLLCDRDFQPITPDSTYNYIKILSNDRYLAGLNRGYEILDKEGNKITSLPRFRSIRQSVYGYLLAQSEDNRRYALLDHDGNWISEHIYSELTFCKTEKEQRDLCNNLMIKQAIAKYQKPNGERGYLTGLGQELPE